MKYTLGEVGRSSTCSVMLVFSELSTQARCRALSAPQPCSGCCVCNHPLPRRCHYSDSWHHTLLWSHFENVVFESYKVEAPASRSLQWAFCREIHPCCCMWPSCTLHCCLKIMKRIYSFSCPQIRGWLQTSNAAVSVLMHCVLRI